MKQMTLIEMDGFLKGKCIPRDLKVNETNAEYLVRKFAEAEAKISALSEDHQKAIESIKQADSAVKLAHEKFSALAAENAGLKSFGDKLNEMHNDLNGEGTGIQGRAEVACQQVALEAAMEEFDAIKTPATDAFLAEVRAQGVKSLSNAVQSVIAERQRHQSAEGWTPEHDDQYSKSQLLWASSCYVLNAIHPFNRIPFGWPWTPEWWKPTNPRRDMVKAGALILAEIERIDRQEAAQ